MIRINLLPHREEAKKAKRKQFFVLAGLVSCWVSCDHIPRRSWPLFRARDVMRSFIETFKGEQAT